MNAGDPIEWYMDIPVVSRAYLTLSFVTSAACALDLVSPFSLYFNYKLIVQKAQVWRLFSNFLFFGTFGLDFVFHMYFLCRYSRLLEENSFRGRTADFVWLLIFGAVLMLGIAPFVKVNFLGSSLSFMMVYVWARRNKHARLSFLGLFPFTAPYLPWVLFTFSVMLGHMWLIDAIGMVVGHLYFYLEDVFPAIAEARGWKTKRLLKTPGIIHWLCGTPPRFDAQDAPAIVATPIVPVPGQLPEQQAQAPEVQAQQPPAQAEQGAENEANQAAVENAAAE